MRNPRRTAAVAGGERSPVTMVNSCDGRQYPQEVEDKLNRLAHLVFNTENGREFLTYLRQITLNSVNPPNTPADVLKHKEGERAIVAVLIERARLGAQP